jgi:hypothetical protein
MPKINPRNRGNEIAMLQQQKKSIPYVIEFQLGRLSP